MLRTFFFFSILISAFRFGFDEGARITLAAAVKEGLKCRFVIEERVPGSYLLVGNGDGDGAGQDGQQLLEDLRHHKVISPWAIFVMLTSEGVYGKVVSAADGTFRITGLTGNEIVYDLYTGTGTIAQFVSKKAKKVIGVESVPEAIKDAKLNAERNEITNCEFFVGDMKVVFNDSFIAQHGHPDVIITDPPRDGMHKDVIEQIMKIAPEKVVYVSCNSATQARDLAWLDEAYEVDVVHPVDMFPQTHHVENIVRLRLRKS